MNTKSLILKLPLYVQCDKSIVLEIVKLNSSEFQYVQPELKKDNDIVWVAIEDNPKLLEYADDKIKNNLNIAKYCLKEIIKNDFRTSKINACQTVYELYSYVVTISSYFILLAPDMLKKDYNIGFKAVTFDGLALGKLDISLQDNLKIVLQALETDLDSGEKIIKCASERIQNIVGTEQMIDKLKIAIFSEKLDNDLPESYSCKKAKI